MKQIIRLMRPRQWYKNTVVFIALFFTEQLFSMPEVAVSFIAFLALCLLSSANYAINDIADAKEDRRHPKKKDRPVASGALSKGAALGIAIVLLLLSLILGSIISYAFASSLAVIFLLTLSYSLWLKREPILDVLLIGINFVLRAVGGALAIDVKISPWLIACAFLLSLFLGFSKRKAELLMLGKRSALHRKVFSYYTRTQLESYTTVAMTSLIISYTLYTFLKSEFNLLITAPIAVYGLLRYSYLVDKKALTSPEEIFSDIRLAVTFLAWGAIVFVQIYR